VSGIVNTIESIIFIVIGLKIRQQANHAFQIKKDEAIKQNEISENLGTKAMQ